MCKEEGRGNRVTVRTWRSEDPRDPRVSRLEGRRSLSPSATEFTHCGHSHLSPFNSSLTLLLSLLGFASLFDRVLQTSSQLPHLSKKILIQRKLLPHTSMHPARLGTTLSFWPVWMAEISSCHELEVHVSDTGSLVSDAP